METGTQSIRKFVFKRTSRAYRETGTTKNPLSRSLAGFCGGVKWARTIDLNDVNVAL